MADEQRDESYMRHALNDTPADHAVGLLPCAVAVLHALERPAGNRRECSPSLRDLSHTTGFSKKSVLKALRRLASSGLLVITPQFADDGGRAPNRYTVRGKQNG